jgi:hypothetical protein
MGYRTYFPPRFPARCRRTAKPSLYRISVTCGISVCSGFFIHAFLILLKSHNLSLSLTILPGAVEQLRTIFSFFADV